MPDTELTAQEKAVLVQNELASRTPPTPDPAVVAKQEALEAYRVSVQEMKDKDLKAEWKKHEEAVQIEAEQKAEAAEAEETARRAEVEKAAEAEAKEAPAKTDG